MKNIRKLIVEVVESTYENVVKTDAEYKKLEDKKIEIIKKFKLKLTDEDYQELEKLVDCLDGQNFLTAMGFSFVRVLDLDKIFEKKFETHRRGWYGEPYHS